MPLGKKFLGVWVYHEGAEVKEVPWQLPPYILKSDQLSEKSGCGVHKGRGQKLGHESPGEFTNAKCAMS